jgi:hypothetical protein
MNALMLMLLCTRLELFFLKDSPDLMVRIMPDAASERIQLCYSFKSTAWDTMNLSANNNIFEARISTPDDVKLLGAYFIYPDGVIDDNNGGLYLYEISIFPRMILPFSLAQLEKMVDQAKNKVAKRRHLDEAVMLLDYVDAVIEQLPYVENTMIELNKNIIKSNIEDLRRILE